MGGPQTYRRRRGTAFVLALVAMLVMSLAGTASGAAGTAPTLVPIGGDYTTLSLEQFSLVAAQHADDGVVDLLVAPSSYGNDPDELAENTELAQERTDQLDAACDAAVADLEMTCNATLLHLFMRSQTEGPEGQAAIGLLDDAATDGVFILGGDQGIAMEVLANSGVEDAMTRAYTRGVVFGGTSAGAAVESVDMINGYTDPGYPENALEKDKVIIWWANDQEGDDDFTRGLIFSAENAINDQHFYQRGRFGRLLNVVAQSDEQYGGASKVGVGIDYQTGVQITDDTTVHGVFGATSVAVIDGESLGATYAWHGPNDTLSARNLVTHIMAPDPALAYDLRTREISAGGNVLSIDERALMDPSLRVKGRSALILGGDVSMDWTGPAAQEFVARAKDTKKKQIMVVVVGPASLGQTYVTKLQAAGLANYQFQIVVFDAANTKPLDRLSFGNTAGVVLLGSDQSIMGPAITNPAFDRMVNRAASSAPVVLTDRAMTAVMGDVYATNPNPTGSVQTRGIQAFMDGNVTVAPGLGIVEGAAFQGRVTYDQHWGRLYSLAKASPDTMVYGISEMTAIVIEGKHASVVGERSVIALDGSQGTYSTGTNGAFSALNVVMDLYAPGDAIE